MCGVKVKFPAKAYPSQVAMMSKIVTSLQRSQNSLLESPTGSGKSLALLCAALAWQEAEQKKCDEFNELLEVATKAQDPAMRDALVNMAGNDGVEWEEDIEPTAYNNQNNNPIDTAGVIASAMAQGGGFIPVDPDDADFAEPRSKKSGQPEASYGYHVTPPLGDTRSGGARAGNEPQYLRMPKKRKCPRIYFGTRTHKQVAQIVRELKKTAYAGVRMTILASREHTCIHPTVSKSFNKNQDCQELMDRRKGGGCRFQANVKQKMSSHHSARAYMGTDQAWDLEELVTAGKKVKCCPYFVTRELKNAAQIIICPYNYLVEPNIRKSMEIFLKNQIVILDEAHNIEDSAREAASGKFKLDDVTAAMQDCERMVDHEILPEVHGCLASFLSRLGTWMMKAAEEASDYNDFNSSTKVWTGTKGLAEWNQILFQPESYNMVKTQLQEALKEQSQAGEMNEDGFEEGQTKILSKMTSDLLEGIFSVLDFMHRKDSLYRDDYRMAVVKAQERTKKGGKAKGWTGRGDTPALVSTVTLNFWCLNPGVCFDEMLDCKSIVLTSGTLSPMVTFASELEVKFPITLEANHVIDKSQVWVGTVGTGPTGYSLNASYQNANTYGFQDEVGRLLLDICRTVPHGVLIFVPSYKMLNDLTERWKSNGTWQQLWERKAIVSEPRFADQLDGVMKEFYSAIEESTCGANQYGQDGALFLAVCRGKVSEGLDFADNNARAVVCVGIPFPAFKDTLVDLKRKYNDERRVRNPNILMGRDWYEIQAFRALNQALGRCIRHKKDWGAILMVDGRYSNNPRYVNSLSKWVRGKVVHYDSSNNMINTLRTFSSDMKLFDAENASAVDAFAVPSADHCKPSTASNTDRADLTDQKSKTYFPAPNGGGSSAWSPDQVASKTLSSKVSDLINMRKTSPKTTKDLKGWGKGKKKLDSSVSNKSIDQPRLSNLNSEDNLDTNTHLAYNLDNKSHLSLDLNNYLEGEIVRLGAPKSRGRQKKLKDQSIIKNYKVDWNDPELPPESILPNMNFKDDITDESVETLYTDSTKPSLAASMSLVDSGNSKSTSNKNKNLKMAQASGQKSRKMCFVSSDEEEDCSLKTATETSSSDTTMNHESNKISRGDIRLSRVEKNQAIINKIITSETLNKKESGISIPECNFDLTEEFDLVDDDNTNMKDKKSTDSTRNFVQKLQVFKFGGDDDNDKGDGDENEKDIKERLDNVLQKPPLFKTCNLNSDMDMPPSSVSGVGATAPRPVNNKDIISSILSSESVKRKSSSPECNFDLTEELDLPEDFELIDHNPAISTTIPVPGVKATANKKSRLSTGKKYKRSSQSPGQILRYSSVTELEKENSDDRDLVNLMLKRRRESGQLKENHGIENMNETVNIVLETPDEVNNLDLGSDFEADMEFEPTKSNALKDVSNHQGGTRKPLFSHGPCNPVSSSPSIIYSSGDEVCPLENKVTRPSLSSADEIEEPEDFIRKVKHSARKKSKKKSEGGNRQSGGNKTRVSLSLGPLTGPRQAKAGNNSDDDFM